MFLPIPQYPFPYQDTRIWIALRDALRELEKRGAIQVSTGESHILALLCGALDRAGVFSLGERIPVAGR